MESLFRFLANYEGVIYVILAFAAVFSIRWLMRALADRRDALFGLEREMANQRFNTALGTFILIVLLFLSEMILASFVSPLLPGISLIPTPTVNLLATPTGTLSPELQATLNAPSVNGEAPFGSVGCVPGKYVLTSPRPSQEVNEIVDLIGTVNIPNLGFYKFEVAAVGTENWKTIFAGNESKIDTNLGAWDTSELTPGDYNLRLVVTDNQGQALPPCVVPVRIVP